MFYLHIVISENEKNGKNMAVMEAQRGFICERKVKEYKINFYFPLPTFKSGGEREFQ